MAEKKAKPRGTFPRPAVHASGCYPAVCRGVAGISDCTGACPSCGSEACAHERFQVYATGADAPVCPNVTAETLAEEAEAIAAAVADIGEAVWHDGRWVIQRAVPPRSDYECVAPGSEWEDDGDALLERAQAMLPPGWVALWSDDDLVIQRAERAADEHAGGDA
jgi:hypothetical protein